MVWFLVLKIIIIITISPRSLNEFLECIQNLFSVQTWDFRLKPAPPSSPPRSRARNMEVQLIAAIRDGDLTTAKDLVEDPANEGYPYTFMGGATPLHWFFYLPSRRVYGREESLTARGSHGLLVRAGQPKRASRTYCPSSWSGRPTPWTPRTQPARPLSTGSIFYIPHLLKSFP